MGIAAKRGVALVLNSPEAFLAETQMPFSPLSSLRCALAAAYLLGLTSLAHAEKRELCFVLPLSGGQHPFGESIRRGAEFAKIEAQDCPSADAPCALKETTLTFEDHQGEPARAATAVRRLLQTNSCDGFVVFGSPPSLAVADILERAKKPTIAMGSTDKIQSGRQHIFRSMPSSLEATKPLVEEAVRRGLQKVASVSTEHDGMLANRDAFAAQRGSPFIKSVAVNPGETDFRAIAAQLNAAKPDGIFVTLMPPQASLFARQVRQVGYRGELFSTNQVESTDEIRAAGSAFDGLWYSREGGPESGHFFTEVSRRFPDGALTFAYLGYDASRILSFGLRTPNPIEAINRLQDFPGALGPMSTKPDHSIDGPIQLMVIQGGALVRLENGKDEAVQANK